VITIFAGTKGFADGIEIDEMKEWEAAMLRYMDTSHPEIVKAIAEDKKISDETEEKLRSALESFNNTWS
jgi:F-type H+-transporting ATPase subunit alpha